MGKFCRMLVCLLMMLIASSVAFASTFEEGDEGQDVAMIQARLSSLGYQVNADGDFGGQTAAAVKAFQTDKGMVADGIVGSQTYRLLMGRDIPVSRDSSATAARRLIQTANRYIGVPYVFGGTTPAGFDCSGFMRFVYARAGVSLPRMADEQFDVGQPVASSQLQPGDMVFFSTYEPGPSHVGIYLGGGRFIHASSSQGIRVDSLGSSYWGPRYIGARRVL